MIIEINRKHIHLYNCGEIDYTRNRLLRGRDLPAIINDTSLFYLYNGNMHRANAPAHYSTCEELLYYNKGYLHSVNNPAIIGNNRLVYFVNGKEILKIE